MTRRRLPALAGLLLLVSVSAAAAAPDRIALRPSARVEGGVVRLGHVSRTELPAAWSDVVVGAVEWPGSAVAVGKARIRRILSGAALGPVPVLEGPDRIEVQRTGRTLTPARLEAAVRRTLAADGGDAAQRWTFRSLPRLPLVDGPVQVRVVGDLPAVGSGQVALELTDAEGTRRRAHIGLVRAVRVRARVATADLTRGERLGPNNTALQPVWVESAAVWKQLLRDGTDIHELETVRPVVAGSFLQRNDLRAMPHVERGSLVRWTVHRGAVVVESEVVARGEGRVGDWIHVKSPFGGRLRRVKVTGPGTVGDPLPPSMPVVPAETRS